VEAVEGQTRAKGGFLRQHTRRRRENRGDGSAARRGKGREANKRGVVGPGGARETWRRSSGGVKPIHSEGIGGEAKTTAAAAVLCFPVEKRKKKTSRAIL
jgi:hypothetical protein